MKIDTIDILICAKMTQQIKLSHIDIGIAGERSHRDGAQNERVVCNCIRSHKKRYVNGIFQYWAALSLLMAILNVYR